MDPASASAAAAMASAIAAFLSLIVSIRSTKLTSRTLQLQIPPCIGIKFDHAITGNREKTAHITNDGGCEISDLQLNTSIVTDFEEAEGNIKPLVYKSVSNHDFRRWFIAGVWQRHLKTGYTAKIDSDPWFTHAREVLSLPNLAPPERAARGIVVLEISCRRTADNRQFDFKYVYMVQGKRGNLIAIPISGSNPADAGSQLILGRVDDTSL